jgi:hypothetical protein
MCSKNTSAGSPPNPTKSAQIPLVRRRGSPTRARKAPASKNGAPMVIAPIRPNPASVPAAAQ